MTGSLRWRNDGAFLCMRSCWTACSHAPGGRLRFYRALAPTAGRGGWDRAGPSGG